MEGEAGFFIIAVVGLTSLILPLASVACWSTFQGKSKTLRRKLKKCLGWGFKHLEPTPSVQTSEQ